MLQKLKHWLGLDKKYYTDDLSGTEYYGEYGGGVDQLIEPPHVFFDLDSPPQIVQELIKEKPLLSLDNLDDSGDCNWMIDCYRKNNQSHYVLSVWYYKDDEDIVCGYSKDFYSLYRSWQGCIEYIGDELWPESIPKNAKYISRRDYIDNIGVLDVTKYSEKVVDKIRQKISHTNPSNHVLLDVGIGLFNPHSPAISINNITNGVTKYHWNSYDTLHPTGQMGVAIREVNGDTVYVFSVNDEYGTGLADCFYHKDFLSGFFYEDVLYEYRSKCDEFEFD